MGRVGGQWDWVGEKGGGPWERGHLWDWWQHSSVSGLEVQNVLLQIAAK